LGGRGVHPHPQLTELDLRQSTYVTAVIYNLRNSKISITNIENKVYNTLSNKRNKMSTLRINLEQYYSRYKQMVVNMNQNHFTVKQ